ncbi:Phosphatidylinositol 3,4,5-trisphosphate-dependent Rac exchanger 2 protein [Phlyctochytrium bullatum]|nr:Phosphatidylinositol 3,4,5-trisphosphate-dependent Rac exchanger 2 protein [Phlyctochytrium bullatum]
MILYGMDRKTVMKPLDFVNGTQKGDESMTRNLVQLSILSFEKGFRAGSFNPAHAKEALDSLNQPISAKAEVTSSTSSLDTNDAFSRLSQRIEVLDAGMSRMIKAVQEKIEKSEKTTRTTQVAMDKLLDTLDLVFRKLVDIDTAQKDISERIQTFGHHLTRRSRPVSMTDSEIDDLEFDSSRNTGTSLTTSTGAKPRLQINPEGVKRGLSSDSLLNAPAQEDQARRTLSSAGKATAKSELTSVNIAAASSSPSLLGTSPQTPVSPKLFAKLPIEVLNARLSKSELMRLSVIYELIETEADYYHKPEVRNTKLVSEQDTAVLFSNVEQLITVHNQLMSKLNLKRESNPVIEEIGDVLVEIAESLRIYAVYCGNYPQAMKLVHQLQSRPDFKEFITKWMNSVEGRGLSLESFLIKPVQRICKYPLLLRELLKHVDKSHKDYANLSLATEKIELVVAQVNEATQALDRKERLLALLSKIDSPNALNLSDKRLLKDGVIQKISSGKSKERFLLLCAEVLVTCKVQAKFRYQFESATNTGDISLKTDFKGGQNRVQAMLTN